MAPREILAAVLGIGLGLFFVAFPEVVVRVHTAGRVPGDRRGEYGEEGGSPRSWLLLVRAVGAVAVLVGLFIAGQQLALW